MDIRGLFTMDYLLGMYFNNHDLFISVSVKVMRG